MKKDKLYTVNQHNKRLLSKGANIFWPGGPLASIFDSEGNYIHGYNPYDVGNPWEKNTTSYMLANNMVPSIASSLAPKIIKDASGLKALKQPDLPAVKGGSALLNNLKAAAPAIGGVVGNVGNKVISDGYDANGIGAAMTNVGATLGSIAGMIPGLGPLAGGIISAGSGILGGVVNRTFGTKRNEANIATVEQNANTARSVGADLANVQDNDSLRQYASNMASNLGFSGRDLVKGGIFAKRKAAKENSSILGKQSSALAYQTHGFLTGAEKADRNIDDVASINSVAFGGPLNMIGDNNMGAIEYGFLNDYLTAKSKQAEAKGKLGGVGNTLFSDGGIVIKHPGRLTALKKRTGKTEAELWAEGNPNVRKMITFARSARKWNAFGGLLNNTLFALGGDIQTHGSDWSTGMTHINAGSSHEENPYQGVQVGIDPQGKPNLVEEGEVIFNDYVYSDRIYADGGTLQRFHLPRKKKITYAKLAKWLEREISERPEDPISKASFKAQMASLAEEQERQKQEADAERARQAFEALSDEEKIGLMDYANAEQQAEQLAMQEQAMQEPIPEEAQYAEAMPQEGMMAPEYQADGSEANLGAVAAYGGNLYPWGGYENLFNVKPPYAPSNMAGYIPYTRNMTEAQVLEKEADPIFQAWTKYVNDNWDTDEVQGYLKALDKAAGGNHLFDKNGAILKDAKDYFNRQRTQNHLWGYYHLTPEQIAENTATPAGKVIHMVRDADGNIEELVPDQTKWVNVNPAEDDRRVDKDTGITYIYHKPEGKEAETVVTGDKIGKPDEGSVDVNHKLVPKLKNESLRYAGLFGPAVAMGLMGLGVGKPNFRDIDAALSMTRGSALAIPKYIGNYLHYSPMDVWAEQNRLNAQSRATDRAIQNNAAPVGTQMAGLIANGVSGQSASGDLFRKGLEYDNALNQQVQGFNRGTDQFNADAFNKVSLANAEMQNRVKQFNASMAMQAANQKLAANNDWYGSLYGNLSGLFKGISDLGRENAQHNMIARMAADGLFGPLSDQYIAENYVQRAAEGGKIKKNRKHRKGGLTI